MRAVLKDFLLAILGLVVAVAGAWWEFASALADRFIPALWLMLAALFVVAMVTSLVSSRWRVVLSAAAVVVVVVPLILASFVESGAVVWLGAAVAHFCTLVIGGLIGHICAGHGARTTA